MGGIANFAVMNEKDYRHIPVDRLALQLAGRTDMDVPHLLRQVEGWQRLRSKVPSWAAVEGLEYPPRLSLEQCSGEEAAAYKVRVAVRLLSARSQTGRSLSMVDLTGGLGVDFSALSRHFAEADYVERREELCRLARHNFPLLGLSAGVHVSCASAADYLHAMSPVDFIYLDPARRDNVGRKTVRIEDCEPDVAALRDELLAKGGWVMIKLSPMLDIAGAVQTLGTCVREVHVVGVGGECKELLLLLAGRDASECGSTGRGPMVVATDGRSEFSFYPEEEAQAQPVMARQVGSWLYEPDAALLKAGAFKLAAVRYGLAKLQAHSHLYTSEEPVREFPGRVFQVERTFSFSKADVRRLREVVGGRANLTVRNFPLSVAALRKKLKLAEGGQAYLFATTLADDRHALILAHRRTSDEER